MGHESYSREEQVEGSSNRAFGLVFVGFFALIGVMPAIFGGRLRLWALLLSIVVLLLTLLVPSALTPLNRLWMRFGLLLHRVVSPIVLGIMFFLVVTPTGWLMRAMGKDPLRLRRDPGAASYWIERVPPGPSPESLKNQF